MADNAELVALTADIVSAHLSNNSVATADVPALIQSIHAALAQTANPVEAEAPKQEPAVSIKASVKHDHLVSLESGKKVKMLKRYLMTNYGMTPDDYRKKWGLPRNYPMVAPAYAATRAELARAIGLGRKKAGDAVEAVEDVAKSAGKKLGIVAAKAAAAAHLGGGEDAPKRGRGRPAKAKPVEEASAE